MCGPATRAHTIWIYDWLLRLLVSDTQTQTGINDSHTDKMIPDQKKGLCSHACMECVRIGVSQTSKHYSSKPVPPIWQNVPPSHLPGHCLSCVDSYFCKVVAVPFFFTTRCPALTYPSFRAADTGKKCSVINDRNHLSNVFINVTTKYFQPLPITRTCSIWNILTSKHLL